MIEYTIASLTDLTGILDLQSRNHAVQLSREQIEKEGFVTLHHSEQLLKKMNSPFPHIIAKDGVQVVGYALVLHKDLKEEVTGLTDMFEQLKSVKKFGRPILDYRFFIMCQICIDKKYRKQGIFKGLYSEMSKRMSDNFDFVITEIATKNVRSMQAHLATGFEVLRVHHASDNNEWAIVNLHF